MSNTVENENVEVIGASVQVIVQALGRVKDIGLNILKENGIDINVPAEDWMKLNKFVKALHQIGDKFGPNTLFLIGKTVPEIIQFPPMINSFEIAMKSINVSYVNSHKNLVDADIYFKFTKTGDTSAIMSCTNPYPSEFDRGIISGLARKFPPDNAGKVVSVLLDTSKPSRKDGASSCTFNLTW